MLRAWFWMFLVVGGCGMARYPTDDATADVASIDTVSSDSLQDGKAEASLDGEIPSDDASPDAAWRRYDPVDSISGFWGATPSDVWAITGVGEILRFDGTSWKLDKREFQQQWFGIWGSAANDIWVVGSGLRHFDGMDWSAVAPPTKIAVELNSIWGTAVDDIWAVGDEDNHGMAELVYFDGKSWTDIETAIEGDLNGVWGSSPSDVWVVGYRRPGRGQIFHFDGTRWSEQNLPSTWALNDIWGSAPDNIWAVGHSGTLMFFDGKTWSEVPSPTQNNLYGVWGCSASDVWAVGARAMRAKSMMLHFDGHQWRTVTLEASAAFSIWGTSCSDVWAGGSAYAYRYH